MIEYYQIITLVTPRRSEKSTRQLRLWRDGVGGVVVHHSRSFFQHAGDILVLYQQVFELGVQLLSFWRCIQHLPAGVDALDECNRKLLASYICIAGIQGRGKQTCHSRVRHRNRREETQEACDSRFGFDLRCARRLSWSHDSRGSVGGRRHGSFAGYDVISFVKSRATNGEAG